MIGNPLHLPPAASALVRVSSQGPFAVGALVWRDARGRLTCTVVAKATYELVPGESAPLDAPHPIQEDDSHWDDDASRSVHVPSDLAPFKHAAEVVVVGSAFASAPVASLVARVVVAGVDKSIEAFPPRHFRQDGTLSPPMPLPRFSLRYERAAGGGPGTENPSGIDVSRPDNLGRRPVPQLLPPFFTPSAPGEHVPTVGFGPIAPTWPSRAAALGPNDRAWLRHPSRAPLPQAFPARFFQAAPPDQWLDRALAANERIVLEGMHPEVGRLVMSLSGLEPRAIVAGPGAEALRLTADLLFVDTDQAICTLTYRAQIPLEEGGGTLRVVVVGASSARDFSPDEVGAVLAAFPEGADRAAGAARSRPPPADAEGDDVETTHVESISLPTPAAGSTGKLQPWLARPVLPFAYEPSPRAPQPTSPDGALPFRSPEPAPPPPAPPPFPTPVPAGAVPAPPAPPAPPPPRPSLASAPIVPPPPPPPRPSAPTFAPVEAPKPPVAAPAPPAPPAPPPPRPTGRASLPSASFDAAFGGVKAASDAAARAPEPPAAKRDPPPADAPAPREAGKAPSPPAGQRQAVVSLVSFDARILPRVRSAARFAAALAPRARPRRSQGVDEPRQEAPPDDRSDVLRVLSCGRPAEAAEIHRALADSLDDPDDLEPPLVLVAGELRPIFDEVEVLRATMAIAQQVAGGDKKVLAAIAVGQEALAAPVAPRPETTLGLVRQIEQAAGALSLPQRFVAAEAERVLVEGRKYKRRALLGAARVRADLTLARGGEVMSLYLPDTAAPSLPLLLSFPVVALCEVTPREDLTEGQDEALFALALGRVLRSR